jgi:hemolysin activation/secretion protein
VGGILGYHATALAGARRNVMRGEFRWSRPALIKGADLGIAPFAELGTIWEGDAPYGVTATRSTLGFSILAAYPTRSKRLYRADVGFPHTRGNGAGIEVRFSSQDRATDFWNEPEDVSRARTGAVPVSLFAWSTR